MASNGKKLSGDWGYLNQVCAKFDRISVPLSRKVVGYLIELHALMVVFN